MRSTELGQISDGLWYLGSNESGVYFLKGSHESMIISGGMSHILSLVVSQCRQFQIDIENVNNVLILHSHFDHIGIIPFLMKANPKLKVYASKRAWEILNNPKSIDTINEFSQQLAEHMGMAKALLEYDTSWPYGVSGEIISEGDVIYLGNIKVNIMETPGHSSCSISAYVPELKAVFPSDGGGIPYKGTIVTAANSNFDLYQQSLQRLNALDVEFVCSDHFGYSWGTEATEHFSLAIESAEKERRMIEEIYLRVKDIDAATKEVTDLFYAQNPDYFLVPEIYQGVTRQIVRYISKQLDKR